MSIYSILADRCEAATGPDVDLNRDILVVLGWRVSGWDALKPDGSRALTIPDYTADLNAATTLVPEGCGWIAGWGQTLPGEPMAGATVSRNARFVGFQANYDQIAACEAATPELAMCAAAFRARIAVAA